MSKNSELKTKTTTETRWLRVELTQDEILKAAEALAEAIDNIHKLSDEKESVVKSFKAKEAALEAEITTQQLLVRNKYDVRNVECHNVMDYETLETYSVRLDTKEEVVRRKMTDEEKQSTLPFDGE